MGNETTYIREIISSVKPLPPRVQHFGATKVAWWEGKPGDAVIMASEGTAEDRILAEKVVAAQLEGFGYKRALFHFAEADPTDILDREREGSDEVDYDQAQHERVLQRQDNWNDLVEKAKRIVNTGGVTLIRNSPEYIVGRVQGDHGNYESEIMQQDPDSQVITGWSCTCPWNQYAWQRTRQWKIYEGRPCSHVLALYYVARQAPVEGKEEEFVSRPPDLEGPPKAVTPKPVGEPSPFAVPTGEAMPGGVVPSVPEGPRGLQRLTPFEAPDVQETLEQRLGPLAPPREAPIEGEPEEVRPELMLQEQSPRPEKIQRSPIDILKERQRQEQQWTRPGEAPYGAPAPPGTVSVPGIRQPNERNPFGSIWSSVHNGHRLAAAPGWFTYKPGDAITLSDSVIGIAEGPSNANGVGEYLEVDAGKVGEVADQDATTGFIDAIFPLEGGANTPTHVRCFLSPDQIVPPVTPEAKAERRDPDAKLRPFGS